MNTTALLTSNAAVSHSLREEEIARNIFIACEVVSCVLLLATLYILVCMIAYGVEKQKWKSTGRRSDVNGGLVYSASVVAVAMTIPRYVVDQIIFNITHINGGSEWCETVMDLGNVTYFVGIYPIYVFLWLRQKALYGHPAMKRLAGKCVDIFSWVTLVSLSIAAIGVGLMFVLPNDYDHDINGCVIKPSLVNASYSDDLAFNGGYYALLCLLVIAQFALLSLFIYPMLRSNAIQNERKASRQVSAFSDITDSTETSQYKHRGSRVHNYFRQASRKLSTSSNGRSNALQRIIRRSVICAGISMLSDIIAMAAVAVIIPPAVPRSLTNTVYDISMLVSVLCILVTFEKYKVILTVFCKGDSPPGSERPSNSADDSRKNSEKFQSISNQSSTV